MTGHAGGVELRPDGDDLRDDKLEDRVVAGWKSMQFYGCKLQVAI